MSNPNSRSQRRKRRLSLFAALEVRDTSFIATLTATGGDVLSKAQARAGAMTGRHMRKQKYQPNTWIKHNPKK